MPIVNNRDSAPIDLCMNTAPIDLCRDTAPIDLCRDTAPIDLCRDAVPIDMCRDAAPIDLHSDAVPTLGPLGMQHPLTHLCRNATHIDLCGDRMHFGLCLTCGGPQRGQGPLQKQALRSRPDHAAIAGLDASFSQVLSAHASVTAICRNRLFPREIATQVNTPIAALSLSWDGVGPDPGLGWVGAGRGQIQGWVRLVWGRARFRVGSGWVETG